MSHPKESAKSLHRTYARCVPAGSSVNQSRFEWTHAPMTSGGNQVTSTGTVLVPLYLDFVRRVLWRLSWTHSSDGRLNRCNMGIGAGRTPARITSSTSSTSGADRTFPPSATSDRSRPRSAEHRLECVGLELLVLYCEPRSLTPRSRNIEIAVHGHWQVCEQRVPDSCTVQWAVKVTLGNTAACALPFSWCVITCDALHPRLAARVARSDLRYYTYSSMASSS